MKPRIEILRLITGLVFLLLAVTARAQDPAGDLLLRAREAAGSDRHREAIDLYRQALAADSALVADAAIELAHQYTWAEIPDSAIIWYETYLRYHPDDFDARHGIARALAWSDRLTEAELRYRELAAERPGDVDVQLGLARVVNWQDRHDEAAAMYENLMLSYPERSDVAVGLAYATHWNGETDRALRILANAPPDPEVTSAEVVISRAPRPGGSVTASNHHDNDGTIRLVRTDLYYWGSRQTRVGVGYAFGTLQNDLLPKVTRNEIGISAEQVFGDRYALTANVGYQDNRFGEVTLAPGETFENFELVVWDVYATMRAEDRFRVDLGTARQSVDVPVTVVRGISTTSGNVGLDWRLSPQVMTTVEARYSSYSDSNARLLLSQELDWQPAWQIPYGYDNHFVLSEGVAYLDYKKSLDNGYYNPDNYIVIFGGARFVTDLGSRFNASLFVRLGPEKAANEDWSFVGFYEALLRYRVSDYLALTAGYEHSDARIASPGGYEAELFFVTADFGLGR